MFKARIKPGAYRHIVVDDYVNHVRKTRTLMVTCPLEYPGLSPHERRRMYEGLAMVADAFRDADRRCAKEAKSNKKR
jgi:hypothetical protein